MFSIGLDRLNNDLRYDKDNVVSCCDVCNKIRGMYLSSDEMVAVAKLLIAMRSG
jgi:hypothetical protein